ncbi:hypothetical protein Cgig2_004169 [Carnegiea gigantea]|uniref:Uncharacterized protein n=1 Tax=Carnegiea gigantea TaxID=171969 RepID=A0A9Q1QP93_9CARY|nr:hypothetical protein Cgig2_004169 [Carnegiea gigantea]
MDIYTFPENAELDLVWWLEIKGQISTKLLSPDTSYGVYFMFKLRRVDCTGFEDPPVTLSVSKVDKDGHRETLETNSVCLKPQGGLPEDLPCLVQREDGWMEIEMGTYHVSIDEGGCIGDDSDRDSQGGMGRPAFLSRALNSALLINWNHTEHCRGKKQQDPGSCSRILFLFCLMSPLPSCTCRKQEVDTFARLN